MRDWERGGLLEAIAYYRSKLEAVVFMWVPAHLGIACNAYADAVATAYLGNNDTEDASKVKMTHSKSDFLSADPPIYFQYLESH